MPTISEIREQYPQYSDMSDADLAGALHKKFYSDMPEADFMTKIGMSAPVAEPSVDIGADALKSGGIGIAKGAIGLGGLPGDIRSLASSATDYVGGKLGVSPETIAALKRNVATATPISAALSVAPTSQQIQSGVESVTGEFYKPQSLAGEYAQTVGEFLPGAVAGPGGIARRAVGQVLAPALTSETAGQATKGTALEPYARIAGGVAGGLAGARATSPKAAAAPAIEQVQQAATQGYKSPEVTSVVFNPNSVQRLSNSVLSELDRAKLNVKRAPETRGLIDDLKTPINGAAHTVEDLQTTRELLGKVAGNFTNTVEQAAASKAISALDKYLANVPQSHLLAGDAKAANAAMTAARGNYASAKTAERVAEKLKNAELQAGSAHSGGNIDNATRQKLRTLLTSKKGKRGFTEDELAQLETAVVGSRTGNLLRAGGKLLGGGGGLGAGIYGLASTVANPLLAVAPAVGYGLKTAGDAMTRRQAQAALQAILARSPLGQSMGAGVRPPNVGAIRSGLLGGLLGSTEPRAPSLLPFDQRWQPIQ
jgi:hypothetical protein